MASRAPTKTKTRTEQKDETRTELLRAGRSIFTKHGYDATSVAMLCRAARMTHGALYHHFPSKLDLFIAITEELAREVATRVQHAADARAGWKQVEAASSAYLDACAEPEVAAIFLRDAPRVIPPATFARLDHGANEPVVLGLLRRWIDAGLMQPFPVEIVGRMLGAAFAEAGSAIASSPKPKETRRVVARVLDTWLESLRVTSAERGSNARVAP